MHLSHLFEDLQLWYRNDYATRVGQMFSKYAVVPSDSTTVTLPNGPADVVSKDDLLTEAGGGHVKAQFTPAAGDATSRRHRRQLRSPTAKRHRRPLREDFNTIDNPFYWSANPVRDGYNSTGAAGLHFVAFVPASSKFHAARMAMDGVLPDGTNLRTQYNLTDTNIGLNAAVRTSHRQNYLIPPRAHRSFPSSS